MPFVSSSIYKKAIGLMIEEGLSPHLLQGNKSMHDFSSNSKYLPMEMLLHAYELAELHLESVFSIRQGSQLNTDDYGTLGLSWKTIAGGQKRF